VTGFLFALLQPATRTRYLTAYATFERLANPTHTGFFEAVEESQDFILAEFIVEWLELGGSHQMCVDLVAMVQKMFAGRRKYRASFLVLEGWKSQHPGASAAPMLEEVCYAMVSLLVGMGRDYIAATILLCFVLLLRVGEALGLHGSDVVFPERHGFGACVIVLLRRTKTDAPGSVKLFVWNPHVIAWLRHHVLKYNIGDDDRFCNCSYATVARWLSRCGEALGFAADQWRTHSLRRGGATALALRGLPMSEIMELGRWTSLKSARLYIQTGNVALTRMRANVSDAQWASIHALARVTSAIHSFEFP
jgi:integrase